MINPKLIPLHCTQVAENERQEVKCSDTDDGLDKLLRKAVTVSQVNLPIATIDRDIDDIASSYSEESERPDNVLDEEFLVMSKFAVLFVNSFIFMFPNSTTVPILHLLC